MRLRSACMLLTLPRCTDWRRLGCSSSAKWWLMVLQSVSVLAKALLVALLLGLSSSSSFHGNNFIFLEFCCFCFANYAFTLVGLC